MMVITNMVGANKILVVGTSCTGKTTLASKIGKDINIPHYDLDDFHWLPNWMERPDNEMLKAIEKSIVPNEKWIVSGNYTGLVKDILWTEADTIIWLDYSLPLILSRFFKRSYRRIVLKEPCCNGNYESFYNSFIAKDNLLFWILKTYPKRKRQFNHWQKNEFKDKNWIVLKSPNEEASSFALIKKAAI